jgi:hypothetical protein
MSFDPKNLLVVSEQLSVGDTEAHVRSHVNRAYYAAFGHLKKRLPNISSGISAHQELINYLRKSNDLTYCEIGRKLEALFKKRKDADYMYDIEMRKNCYTTVLSEAQKIIQLFDSKSREDSN